MKQLKYHKDLVNKTDKLREMIQEHPDLPLVIFAGEEANSGDYSWMGCTDVYFQVGKVLDAAGPNDEKIYLDYDELEDDEGEQLYCEFGDIPDAEYEAILKERMAKYDEDWVDCIIIYATN